MCARRAGSVVAAVVMSSAFAGGCGGEEKLAEQSAETTARLRTVAKKLRAVETYRSTSSIFARGNEEASFEGTGTSTADGFKGRYVLTFHADGRSRRIDAIFRGSTAFARAPEFDRVLPRGKRWVRFSGGDLVPSTTPTPDVFVSLMLAGGHAENLGHERIGTRRVTHYRGPVDINELAKGTSDSSRMLRDITGGKRIEADTTIDVWVPRSALPVRLEMSIAERGEDTAMARYRVDDIVYDVPLHAKTPPARTVVDAADVGLDG